MRTPSAASVAAASLAILASTLAPSPARGQAMARFRRCDAEARRNIRSAVRFLHDNMRALKKDYEFNTRLPRRDDRIHRRMSRKLGKLRFSCGTGRKLCDASNDRTGMHALGTASKKLLICYAKMKNYCDLVETVAHEYGHAVGLPRKRVGRHAKDQDDLVYQFGWFARDLCRQRSLSRGLGEPDRSPHAPTPHGGLVIYPKPGFEGTPRPIAGSHASLADMRRLGRNNSVSSIHVLSGTWELCENRSFGGRCALFVDDVRNLKTLKWNDRVTSIRRRSTSGAGWANGTPPACVNVPILFGKAYFRGPQIPLPRSSRDLKRRSFRNDASSLCVPPGFRVMLYDRTRYRRAPLVIRGPRAIARLKDVRRRKSRNWNNAIASVRVTHRR